MAWSVRSNAGSRRYWQEDTEEDREIRRKILEALLRGGNEVKMPTWEEKRKEIVSIWPYRTGGRAFFWCQAAQKGVKKKMPNHVYNVVTLDCPAERAAEILKDVEMDGCGPGSIDFEKIIPMPEDVYRGPLTKKEIMDYPRDRNWYDCYA